VEVIFGVGFAFVVIFGVGCAFEDLGSFFF
jgi:hypothetical protein